MKSLPEHIAFYKRAPEFNGDDDSRWPAEESSNQRQCLRGSRGFKWPSALHH